jgi:AICAR transformylase/IMP cyclohydrolase PurH
MVLNFSHEEIELPKGTTLGVAEETSARIVAAINEEGTSNFRSTGKKHRKVNMVVNNTSFKQYLQDKLGHLSQAERTVMEPILIKYRHIFHEEGSNDFEALIWLNTKL